MPGYLPTELSVYIAMHPDNAYSSDLRQVIKLAGWFKHIFIYALNNHSHNNNSEELYTVLHVIQN